MVAELEGVRGVVAELAKAEDALAHNDAPSARVAALKVRAAVETPAVLLLLARCELGCGRAEQASKVCLDLIRADRQYVPAYSLRGQALAALGDTPQVHKGIQFTTPDIAENGAVVPIRVEVDSGALPNVSKVSVLVEMNPNPLAASFDIPPGTEVYIETRVKVAQTCTLYAVAEADGQLYMRSRETKVTLGGCGG